MLVAERLVEGVRVGPAVRGVEDEVPAASRACLVLQRVHQRLTDAPATEPLRDDESCDLGAQVVALDEVLGVQRAKARDLSLELGDDQPDRRVIPDALDPLGRLLLARRISELAEERGDGSRVSALGTANRYGGGGGPPGGASSSTYVVLLRPHELP